MVTSQVVGDSRVYAAVVVHFTVQNVRHRTALSWNRRRLAAFMEKNTTNVFCVLV